MSGPIGNPLGDPEAEAVAKASEEALRAKSEADEAVPGRWDQSSYQDEL